MACRLSDIAQQVGVDVSTVSLVLNNKPLAQTFKPKTRQRIREVAKELGYQPNAAARALQTKRTGNIGFIISDTVHDVWVNTYFGKQLAGCEQQCRDRGYGLQISRYNLQNIDQFVFPKKVGQRAIDGLVLTGHIASAVLLRFAEFNIPCVSVGDDAEEHLKMAMVSGDVVSGLHKAVTYLAQLGHHRVSRVTHSNFRSQEVCDQVAQQLKQSAQTASCSMTNIHAHGETESQIAINILDQLAAIPAKDRPTALITYDKLCLALITEIERRGLAYPQDLNLISFPNSDLCLYARPALTAIDMDIEQMGSVATKLLIDHLENGKPLDSEQLRMSFPMELIVRDSCLPPQQKQPSPALSAVTPSLGEHS